MSSDSQQHLAIMQAGNKAFRWPKGQTGNPSGMSKFYHEGRKIARKAAPEMMRVLIDLANDPKEDSRVRSVCAIGVLDRAGLKPIDFDPAEEKESSPRFNPRDYTPEELDVIEAALKLMLRPPTAAAAGAENSTS